MKISKMPGFGSYGTIVEDFDWNDPDSYKELKKINLASLVTVVKGSENKFDLVAKNLHQILSTRFSGSKWTMKYGYNWIDKMSDYELEILETTKLWPVDNNYPGWMRVTGKKNNLGQSLGVFGETELLWHNDESGSVCFSPLSVLYGVEHMNTSATCFVQTADWYQEQTESLRSELDNLIAVYNWDNDKIQPGADTINEKIIRSNMVPTDNVKLPFTVTSPGGIKGIYFSNFITGFEGMSLIESTKLLDRIRNELFTSRYQYDHWWEYPTGEYILIDQSITLHMRKIRAELDRKEELKKRMAYRSTGDYADMLDYQPFNRQPYIDQRKIAMSNLNNPDINKTLALGWKHHVNILKPLTAAERLDYIKLNISIQHRAQVLKELALLDKK